MPREIKLAIVFDGEPTRPLLIIARDITELVQQIHGAILKYGEFSLMYRVY